MLITDHDFLPFQSSRNHKPFKTIVKTYWNLQPRITSIETPLSIQRPYFFLFFFHRICWTNSCVKLAHISVVVLNNTSFLLKSTVVRKMINLSILQTVRVGQYPWRTTATRKYCKYNYLYRHCCICSFDYAILDSAHVLRVHFRHLRRIVVVGAVSSNCQQNNNISCRRSHSILIDRVRLGFVGTARYFPQQHNSTRPQLDIFFLTERPARVGFPAWCPFCPGLFPVPSVFVVLLLVRLPHPHPLVLRNSSPHRVPHICITLYE